MFLFLTALDQQGQHREFSCQISRTGKAFDFLCDIVDRGATLLTAYILDNDTKTHLPVDAFDRYALAELEAEWQSVLIRLHEPSPAGSINQESIQWTQLRINHCERQIRSTEQMVSRFKELQNRAEECDSSSGISHHFTILLNRYEQQLKKARHIHQTALNRLVLLQAKS